MIPDPRIALVLAGQTVVANRNTDKLLIDWAERCGLYVFIGRPDPWGRWPGSIWKNPLTVAQTSSRDRAIAFYREHLEHSPALKLRLPELRQGLLRAIPPGAIAPIPQSPVADAGRSRP